LTTPPYVCDWAAKMIFILPYKEFIPYEPAIPYIFRLVLINP
jgi:hypothetical protein